MDHYHAFFDLKPGTHDLELARHVARYMGQLKEQGLIHGWQLSRRKLGLGQCELGEFHCVMQTADLDQLEKAVAPSGAEAGQNRQVESGRRAANLTAALYRGFPGPQRREETV